MEGDVEEARTQYEKIGMVHGATAERFHAERLGLLARTFGDHDKALAHLRYAHDHMAHERPRYAWICLELGSTLIASGHADTAGEARALLEESLGIAQVLGMPTLEERVGQALAGLGAAKEVPASPAGLSPREVQVLRLLAKGRTNKEIGFELRISEKTVMNHVTSIYVKIGAGNRVEAASFAAKHALVEG
jgi:DNA-binding CsgD family transcriptional regulator